MSALREAINRILSFFHKPQRDADLEAELQSHIDLAVEENISKGMPPDEAHRRALVRFGGVQQARERHRHARGLPALDILLQDLRYTLRTLNRNRVFTIVSILILALGIGANIAVFSVVNTLLLRPLPFYDPQRLVVIAPENNRGGLSGATYSVDAYEDLLAQNRSYVDITGYYAFSAPDNSKLTAQGQPKPVTGIAVAANFFHVLGVEPALGRAFTSQEAVTGNPRVTMLSYPFWQRQFGGDPSIIGKPITLDGTPVTIVGVLPESFDFGSVFSPGAKVDFFTPQFMDDIRMQGNTLALIARLNPGVTIAQSRTEARELFPKLYWSRKIPASNHNYTAYPVELKEYVSGKLRRSLIVLWCAVGLILLIVCVNLSNLLLARAAARSKEFALRGALGGTRARLIRQLLTESLVLSTIGAALGLGLAYALVSYLAHQGSIALPLLSSIRIDGQAIAWTLLITVGSAILFGLLPGIKMSSANIQEALKDSGPGMSDGRKHERLRSTLVISEVALACVLIVGAGLLLRSFLHVLDIDLGFQPSTAAAISIDYDYVPQDDKAGLEKRNANFQEILRRINAIPGVQTSGITDNLPLERNRGWGGPRLKGKTYRPGEVRGAFVYIVSPGYIPAMGMRLHGRDFTWQDDMKGDNTVILNQATANDLLPGEDPIGRTVLIGRIEARVIGVVADVHETNVEGTPGGQMYLPITRNEWGPEGANLVVRTRVPPDQLASSVLRTLRDLNPNQPATEFRPVQQIVDHAVSPRRFFVILVSAFALLGLVLAALGIYGVISYSVTQRTQEIGVRMALGATLARVQLDVLRATLILALIGIAVGTVASLAISRLITSLLFGTTPSDPATFAAMILILGFIALLAGYIPARRASRINPMVALRNN